MARVDGDLAQVKVAVRLDGREPYAMFELVALTDGGATLRGPLMLELGEQLALRLTRGDRSVDVEGRITAVDRGDGHADPVTTIELTDRAALDPLLASA
jgi:hypothetical protein